MMRLVTSIFVIELTGMQMSRSDAFGVLITNFRFVSRRYLILIMFPARVHLLDKITGSLYTSGKSWTLGFLAPLMYLPRPYAIKDRITMVIKRENNSDVPRTPEYSVGTAME